MVVEVVVEVGLVVEGARAGADVFAAPKKLLFGLAEVTFGFVLAFSSSFEAAREHDR